MSLRLDWCSHEAAKYAVMNWHYSKSMPVGKTVKVGSWEDERFIGALVFAYGANNNIGGPYGLAQTEVCELVRVALAQHANPVTRMVAVALRMLSTAQRGLRLVVSYADSREGHIGAIYQGGNWVFVGRSPGATEYLWRGRWVHSMQIQTFIRKGDLQSRVGLPTRQAGDKFKYLYPLDDEMRARIAPLAKPYPKRVRSIDSDAPGFQSGEGGAIPTRTLHD